MFAFAVLHDLKIVHTDLKPENILLTNDTPPIVKIADFGLAKVVDTMTVLHVRHLPARVLLFFMLMGMWLMTFQTFCGTPAYIAPEIMRGGQGYDHVVDSWSMGVIVFAMSGLFCLMLRHDVTTHEIFRLTKFTPFNESAEGDDIAARNADRRVEWKVL